MYCGSKNHGISHCPNTSTIKTMLENITPISITYLNKKDLKFAYGYYKQITINLRINTDNIIIPQTIILCGVIGHSDVTKKFNKWTKIDLVATCVFLNACIKEHKMEENVCSICRECIEGKKCTTPPCGHTMCTDCVVKLYEHSSYGRTPSCPTCRARMF